MVMKAKKKAKVELTLLHGKHSQDRAQILCSDILCFIGPASGRNREGMTS